MITTTLLCIILFQPGELPEGWIGREACMECHEDEIGTYDSHLHTKAMMVKGLEELACESCHGPGLDHEDDPTLENILTRMQKNQIAANCVSCHPTQHLGLAWSTSEHVRADVNCLECHQSGHQPDPAEPMLANSQPDLCAQCHQEQAVQFSLPYAHRDGVKGAECSDCHSVHGGLKSTSPHDGRHACVSCHAEKAGPFVYAHQPRGLEGCEACHQPHGSTNPFQLKRADVTQLCLECHADTPLFHDLSQPRYQPCVSCHSAVHGSHRDPMLFEE